MHVRTRWPWISLLLGILAAINPVGLEFLRSAFLSGEQLARNIAQPIVFAALAIVVVAVMLEWLVRSLLIRRRARDAS